MPWLERLTERYLFTGRLVMESGLHIGGGRDTLTTTDSAVMKYIDDRPFIPGSSMKGAFRSAVERVAASLPGVRSCGLLVDSYYRLDERDVVNISSLLIRLKNGQEEVSAFLQNQFPPDMLESLNAYAENTPPSDTIKRYLIDAFNQLIKSSSLYDQQRFTNVGLRTQTKKLAKQNPKGNDLFLLNRLLLEDTYPGEIIRLCPTLYHSGEDVTSADDETLANLCDTCRLFGSPFMAAKVRFSDLSVMPSTWAGITEVRDGVGIDRDSERAVDRIKYDYEVVPSETEFEFRLIVENPDPERHELGLVAVGLRELESGMIPMGGIRTRGLGRCRLEGLKVYHLAFSDANRFKAYLKSGSLETDTFALSADDALSLLDRQIDGLFA